MKTNKNTNQKLILILLSLVMVLSLFAGCGQKTDDGNEVTTNDPVTNSGDGTGTTEEVLIEPNFPEIELGTISIIQRRNETREEWDPERESNTVIQQALIERNNYLSNKYEDFDIEYYYVMTDSEFTPKLTTPISSGQQAYDIVIHPPMRLMWLANLGCLRLVQTVDNVNLDNPWWSTKLNERLSYKGYNFFAVGNANLTAMWRTSAIYFNKSIAESVGLSVSELYQSVFNHTWTLEKMLTYAKQATMDGGDGLDVISNKDTFGIIQTPGFYPAFCGTGLTLADVNDDGEFFAKKASQEIVDRVTSMINYMNNDEIALPLTAGIDQWPHFADGKGLFLVEGIAATQVVRDGEINYGLLPCPLGQDGQTEYHNFMHHGHGSAMAVPVDVDNDYLAVIGAFLEEAGYSSRLKVWPAFYKTLMKGQIARDPESADVMDIIFNNISTDIGLVYSDVYDAAIREMIANNDYTSVKSKLDGLYDSMQEALDEINVLYQEHIAKIGQ